MLGGRNDDRTPKISPMALAGAVLGNASPALATGFGSPNTKSGRPGRATSSRARSSITAWRAAIRSTGRCSLDTGHAQARQYRSGDCRVATATICVAWSPATPVHQLAARLHRQVRAARPDTGRDLLLSVCRARRSFPCRSHAHAAALHQPRSPCPCICSNWPAGFFAAYGHLAPRRISTPSSTSATTSMNTGTKPSATAEHRPCSRAEQGNRDAQRLPYALHAVPHRPPLAGCAPAASLDHRVGRPGSPTKPWLRRGKPQSRFG